MKYTKQDNREIKIPKKKLFFNQNTLNYTFESGSIVTSLALNCFYPEDALRNYKIINL